MSESDSSDRIRDILDETEYAVYSNMRDRTDPRLGDIERKILAHFEKKYPSTGPEDNDVAAQLESAQDTGEYVSCLTPAEAQQVREMMEKDLREFFGGASDMATWKEFALAVGETGAARALDQLLQIDQEYPDSQWRSDPQLMRQIRALNAQLDAASKRYLEGDRAMLTQRLTAYQERRRGR